MRTGRYRRWRVRTTLRPASFSPGGGSCWRAASPSRPIAIPTLAARRLGTLKAIAVTSKQRSPAFPDTPAVAETKGLEDFDFANWFGLLARAGTPQPVLDKLAAAAIGALKEPKVREVLETQAAVPIGRPSFARSYVRSRRNTPRSSRSPE